MSTDVEYMVEEIRKKLVGWQIKDVVISDDKESFGFIVWSDPHGKPIQVKVVWVDRDPEGNGPGWLSIEDQE